MKKLTVVIAIGLITVVLGLMVNSYILMDKIETMETQINSLSLVGNETRLEILNGFDNTSNMDVQGIFWSSIGKDTNGWEEDWLTATEDSLGFLTAGEGAVILSSNSGDVRFIAESGIQIIAHQDRIDLEAERINIPGGYITSTGIYNSSGEMVLSFN